MPNTIIKANAVVRRAMVSENCVISENCQVGEAEGDIALIGQDTTLPAGYVVRAGEQIDNSVISERGAE